VWLEKIKLKNFKRLVDFQAQFSPGINVVKGPLNEMGKSTLLDGIIVALFNNPKSTAKELKDYVSWGSTSPCETSLEFQDKGNKYLLEKDFDKGTVRLTDEKTRAELDTFRKVAEKMAELLGTSSERLFSCSSCIRQSQVSDISSGRKEINESLEEIVSGGKEGTLASQATKKLDDKISEMKRGLDRPAKTPGILARLENELQDALQTYDKVNDEVFKVEARKIELIDVKKQLAEIKERYENARALLDRNEKRRKIEKSVEELRRSYGEVKRRLDGVNELIIKREGANKALTSVEGFENELQVLEFRRSLDAIHNSRAGIREDMAMREEELARARGELNKRKSLGFLGSGKGIATALIILTGGIIGALVGSFYLLVLVVLGAVLLGITIRASRAFIRDKTNISGIEERIHKMGESLDELSKREQELLAKAKCTTATEFDKKETDFRTSLKDKADLEAQLKGMLGGKSLQDFQNQEQETATDLAVEKAGLTDDLKGTALGPEECIKKEREVQSLEAQKAILEKKEMECETTIKHASYNIEDQIRLDERLEVLREELKREQKRVESYELAAKFISQARTEILSSTEEALEKEVQTYLAVFTNGKYKQVRVNKEALEFWVYSDEKGDWARPRELSGGVIDEFYLAFRLALAELIFGDKKPPLILDDPFVNFDPARLANTLNFLKALAADYQIIIFTLGDSYDKVADNIIMLGENTKPSTTWEQVKREQSPTQSTFSAPTEKEMNQSEER
jgi:DNA repair exonuclease SbcCD ATPase subunit